MKQFFTVLTLVIFLIGCGGDSSSNLGNDEKGKSSTTLPKYYIKVPEGTTLKKFSFKNEKIIFTKGCVAVNLYDIDKNEPDRNRDTYITNVTEGNYTYVASKYFNTSNDAYGIVFAKSMNVEPTMISYGTPYILEPAMRLLKTIKLTEEKQIVANASRAGHIKIYDENINFIDDLYVINKPVTLQAGTYYLLISNGSCKSIKNEISIAIF